MARSESVLQERILKDGRKVYYVRFAWDEDLKRYTKTRATGTHSKEEARKRAKEIIKREETGTKHPTVRDLVRNAWQDGSDFLTDREAERGKYSKAALRTYRAFSENHVQKFRLFKTLTVDRLMVTHYKEFRREVTKTISNSSFEAAAPALTLPVSVYCEDHNIVYPWGSIRRLKSSRKRHGALDRSEIENLLALETVENVSPRYLFAAKLQLLTATRIGELAGFMWKDVDFKAGTITIERQVLTGLGITPPKMGSVGTIPMIAPLPQLLRGYRATLPASPLPGMFIVGNPDTGSPLSREIYGRQLWDIFAAIGIGEADRKDRRLASHSLRHSMATLVQDAGLNALQAAALLRHKSVDTTALSYTHVENASFGDIILFPKKKAE